ncbi:MAG: hypothetical protein DME41_09135 [Verrucomicrobia bacterium]|nr:MAG: hypothetical protein DME41_09135 [Verrucomicrobiota bacterium]
MQGSESPCDWLSTTAAKRRARCGHSFISETVLSFLQVTGRRPAPERPDKSSGCNWRSVPITQQHRTVWYRPGLPADIVPDSGSTSILLGLGFFGIILVTHCLDRNVRRHY